MSQCIRNGQGLDVNVLPGHSLLVSSILGSYDATQITGTGGTGLALATASTGGATYGPYASGATIRLRASADGVIEYDSALVPAMLNKIPAFLATDISGNVTGLVSGDGIPNSVSVGNIQGFSAATSIPEIVFDQSKGGKYLFTQYDGTYGNYTSSLSIATGTLTSMTKTSIQTATNVSALKDTAGAAITAGAIVCAWWISETRFMFVGKKNSTNTNYVWICDFNGGAWKVGSNSTTFDNGNAVLALGLYSGGQAALSGVLHSRSVAMNADASKILIAEYNVATGRVSGGANDAIRVYQSTDQGATWSALLTHNTSGNQMRHWHFVKFDAFNSNRPWLIGGGDDPLSALIGWDGSSSAPAANTPLTQAGFAGYPGWEVMHDTAGIECRSGDIAIHPQTLHYMSDNSEVNTATKYNFHISKQKPLQRVRSNEHDRTIGRSPLICCELPNGAAIWGTIREAQDLGAAPEEWQGYDFLYTPDGVSFHKIAKTRDVSSSGTGTLSNIFMSNEGILVISGLNARGCKLRPSASTNGEGSLLVTLQPWDGTVRTLQGSA